MKKIFRLGVMLALLLSLTACSSKLMDPILEQQQPVPQGNEASITFFRTSSFGGIIQAPIAEETASGLELVGISSMDTKIRHVVAPGKHIFVVGGESGSLRTWPRKSITMSRYRPALAGAKPASP